jgi:hypothetical protein
VIKESFMSVEIIAGYHDAVIYGVAADEVSGELVLSVKLENGTRKALALDGCEMFRVVDFTPQNVVSRLMVFRGSSVDENLLAEKLEWITSFCDASSYLSEERRQEIIRRIKAGELSLVVVEPSVGAEIIALCRSIRDVGDGLAARTRGQV